jgi:hypothetical protein
MLQLIVVERDRIPEIWMDLLQGLEVYRDKSPHYLASEPEIFKDLTSPDGDELALVSLDGKYIGFLTFKAQIVMTEIWGTLAIIYLTQEGQAARVLPLVVKQVADLLRERGCTVMNYLTARKGFRRLAPRLGFKARIIEWAKELD